MRLYHFLRYGATPEKIYMLAQETFKAEFSTEEIKKWLLVFLKRFFSQQFKRSCIPDGPKVGTISLSPRGDLRMPSDAEVNIWIERLNKRKPRPTHRDFSHGSPVTRCSRII